MMMPVVFAAVAPVCMDTGIYPLSAVMVGTVSLGGELGLVLNRDAVVAVAMSVAGLHVLGHVLINVDVGFMELGCGVGVHIVELIVNRPLRRCMDLLRVNDLGCRLARMLLGVLGILLKVWVHSLCMDRQGHANETCCE